MILGLLHQGHQNTTSKVERVNSTIADVLPAPGTGRCYDSPDLEQLVEFAINYLVTVSWCLQSDLATPPSTPIAVSILALLSPRRPAAAAGLP